LTKGKQAVLQTSTNLGPSAKWVAFQTNAVSSAVMSLSTPVFPGSHFFRILESP
jgi:hypothetical protein